MNPRIVYFVPDLAADSSGVLHAQVLTPASFLAKKGFECLFIGSEGTAERAESIEEKIRNEYGISAHVFGCYSCRIPYVSFRLTAQKAFRASRKIIDDFQPTHIYSRGFSAAPTVRKMARKTGAVSVLDIRGLIAEETAMRRGKGAIYQILRRLELNEMKKVDRLVCVSHRMKEWIRENTGRADITVIPSCVDPQKFSFREAERRTIRRDCSFTDEDNVICFCGNTAKWQRITDIISLFRDISDRRKNFKFLFLTQQEEKVRQIAQSAGLSLEQCVITRASHDDVASYLSACDAGIIMRDDIVVNNVASPIKIGEYLSCGLPILLTRGIGDYSEMIADAGTGLVLSGSPDDAGNVIDFMEQPGFAELRRKTIDFARTRLSLDSYLEVFRQLYRVKS